MSHTNAAADEVSLPVYGTVKEAMAETGADVSVVFVPPAFTKDACVEAIDAGIGLLVVITEGAGPGHRRGGPTCRADERRWNPDDRAELPGHHHAGGGARGHHPWATISGTGPVGLVSKSGTLTYQMMFELRDGFSTAIGIGGDPIVAPPTSTPSRRSRPTPTRRRS